MFKIKIDCTNYIEPKKPHNNQLYYKNQIIIINTNSKFTYKSLEFEINKKLDINELRQFIIMLQNLGFKSSKKRNTTVQFIDITENNKHIYYKPIHYNKIENENEELIKLPFRDLNKKQSIYKQIELYIKKNYLNP